MENRGGINSGKTDFRGKIMLQAGLIGYGYWGPNVARNFNANPDCELACIADMSEPRRRAAAAAFPHVRICETEDILADPTIDVVAIATPVFTHYELAKRALEQGKHVWVEKPMTSTSEQAEELTEMALARNLVLMVDHTFTFCGPVRKMKELIDSGHLGELYYYDSVRVNLGIFQHDVNVIWDLAPHDLSIMDYLLGPRMRGVSAHGRDHFNTGLEDVAYLCVFYDNNLIAHFHLNWLSPVKIRRTLVGGSQHMVVWDDLDQEAKLRIYDKGMDVETTEGLYRVLATPRIGDMCAPVVSGEEALQVETKYFMECIANGRRPHDDGEAGARIVRLLEAANRSLQEDGRVITL